MSPQQTPSLPDLPPQLFAALQVIERALGDASMTRQRHIEAEQALNNIASYAIEANKKLRSAEPAPVVEAADPSRQ